MPRVLFVTTPPPRNCGVHSFGEATAAVLARSTRYQVTKVGVPENTTAFDFAKLLEQHKPDLVLYNWHDGTMPWLTAEVLEQLHEAFPAVLSLSIAHDYTPPFPQIVAGIQLDSTFEECYREFKVRRLVPDFEPGPAPKGIVLGSFGFAQPRKGFQRLVQRVNEEFDTATLRLHMPNSTYSDPHSKLAHRMADECRSLAKPGITLEITHDNKTPEELLAWLAGNSMNCFLYDHCPGAGISSVIDLALAARRPIAVSDSNMFRSLLSVQPNACVANRSLKSVLDAGWAPFEPVRRDWSPENLLRDYERIFDEVIRRTNTYDMRSNRVLTPADRESLKPVVEELKQLEPDIMSRKIPEAVFQNAFVFQQAKMFARRKDEIVLVGGFEDPIGPALKKLGYNVRITDPHPSMEGKDARDVWLETLERTGQRYDLVISCSVIEHVPDDASFIFFLYQLLKPGGVALLTTDYREDYYEGMHKPDSDVRLYTSERLKHLASLVPGGGLLDRPDWSFVEPYFEIVGARYGFCSLAFRKRNDVPAEMLANHILQHHVRASIENRDKAIDHLSRDNNHLHKEVTRLDRDSHALRTELARFAGLADAGQRTINLLARVHRALKRLPFRKAGKSMLGLMKGKRVSR